MVQIGSGRVSRSVGRRAVLASVAVFAAGALGLAGCSEPAAPGSGEDTTSSEASGEVTLYTSEPQAKIDQIIAAFNEEQPDIEVKVFRAGTGDLKARIEAEKTTGGVAADILLAADVPTFEDYKDQDLFQEFEPSEADALSDVAIDPDGFYVGTRIIPTVIAYNTNEITEPPTSWAELTSPSTPTGSSCPTRTSPARPPSTPRRGACSRTWARSGSSSSAPTTRRSRSPTGPSRRPSPRAPGPSGSWWTTSSAISPPRARPSP